MKISKSRASDPKEFVTSPFHYFPRIEQSIFLLFIGIFIFPLGPYLISNGLPDSSIDRLQIIVQGIPTLIGGLLLVFGGIGLATSLIGVSRKDKDAIDLKVKPSGITVRGGHRIAWESIVSATSVEYENNAKVKFLWDRADLHCSLDVYVDENLDIPKLRMKNGKPYVRINLLRYPAIDYLRLYENTLDQFESRGIPIDSKTKMMQT